MRRLKFPILLIVGILLVVAALPVGAQTYYFSMDEEYVQVFWESDGSIRIEYIRVFTNDRSASPMEFIDIGMPNYEYDLTSIYG